MKKTHLLIGATFGLCVLSSGLAIAHAMSVASKPSWVDANGKGDPSKIADNAQVPYVCWSGKTITLDGKAAKKLMGSPQTMPVPGSPENALAVAKTQELSQIPGVLVENGPGSHTLVIDDNNPAVQKVMKKYEAKERPQCQQ